MRRPTQLISWRKEEKRHGLYRDGSIFTQPSVTTHATHGGPVLYCSVHMPSLLFKGTQDSDFFWLRI
jgi:hypothetical protein